eukprot:TRINITY_DN28633_c0_g1_i1.p1 TRINITY_DN28633_c0_g1~~TRINITY_DN28633_c0_g1_i1.p1  ORF type:complete len:242 (+),score=77.00 TRINITY_DN28633_c0_g1_i1:89-814(+)
MIRRPPRSTLSSSSAASDVYKRQLQDLERSSSTLIKAAEQRAEAAESALEQHLQARKDSAKREEMCKATDALDSEEKTLELRQELSELRASVIMKDESLRSTESKLRREQRMACALEEEQCKVAEVMNIKAVSGALSSAVREHLDCLERRHQKERRRVATHGGLKMLCATVARWRCAGLQQLVFLWRLRAHTGVLEDSVSTLSRDSVRVTPKQRQAQQQLCKHLGEAVDVVIQLTREVNDL